MKSLITIFEHYKDEKLKVEELVFADPEVD